jgi:Elongation factor Tu GTP binding domain
VANSAGSLSLETLADRMLQLTGVVDERSMRAQYLDRMDIERERGITIKSQAVRMPWRMHGQGGDPDVTQTHVLNMIDTPGTSKTELRIWSAVLMPSMRLSPGVQNSGSVPVRAAPRSRPDAKQADFLPRDGDPRARCRDPSPCVLSRTLPTGERLIAWGTLGNPSSNWQPSRFDPHPPSRPLVLRYVRPF